MISLGASLTWCNHVFFSCSTNNPLPYFFLIRIFFVVLAPLAGFNHADPNQTSLLTLQGKSNFINIINNRYQCNGMRHHNNFLPNLFLAYIKSILHISYLFKRIYSRFSCTVKEVLYQNGQYLVQIESKITIHQVQINKVLFLKVTAPKTIINFSKKEKNTGYYN